MMWETVFVLGKSDMSLTTVGLSGTDEDDKDHEHDGSWIEMEVKLFKSQSKTQEWKRALVCQNNILRHHIWSTAKAAG